MPPRRYGAVYGTGKLGLGLTTSLPPAARPTVLKPSRQGILQPKLPSVTAPRTVKGLFTTSAPLKLSTSILHKIIPGYEAAGEDPHCYCNGVGGVFHNYNVRCGLCKFCGARIRGMWFNEHEDACWEKQRA
jgi:hypothetical protein